MLWIRAQDKVLEIINQYEKEIISQLTPEAKNVKADELLAKVTVLSEGTLQAHNVQGFIHRLNVAAGRNAFNQEI